MPRQLGPENVLKNNRKVYDKMTIFKGVMNCLFYYFVLFAEVPL